MSDDPYLAAIAEAAKLGKVYATADARRLAALSEMREKVGEWRAAGLTWKRIQEATGRYYTVLVPRQTDQ